MSRIELIPATKIDATKWNKTIETNNGLIYSRYEYLSHLCKKWEAVVVDDYRAVLPLPVKRKFGLKYYYHPPFIQRLGITGIISVDEVVQIFKLLQSNSVRAHITYESENELSHKRMTSKRSTNLILKCDEGFDELSKRFSRSFHSELKRSRRHEVMYAHSESSTITRLWFDHYSQKTRITKDEMGSFETLCKNFLPQKKCHVRNVIIENEILAAAILFQDESRLYNILNYVSPRGREISANYNLYYSILKEFAGGSKWFDLEGSDIPGVQKFYLKFNPTIEYYFKARLNFLPF